MTSWLAPRVSPIWLLVFLIEACASQPMPPTDGGQATSIPAGSIGSGGPVEEGSNLAADLPAGDRDEDMQSLMPTTPVTTAPPGAVRASVLERQEFKLACLRELGFEGEIEDDLGILTDVAPEQQDEFMEASAACREAAGVEFGISFGLSTREELRRHYRAFLYVRECMIQAGYSTDDPPSLEVYIESGGEGWHPYDAFMSSGGGPSDFSVLEATCPQELLYLESVLDLDD